MTINFPDSVAFSWGSNTVVYLKGSSNTNQLMNDCHFTKRLSKIGSDAATIPSLYSLYYAEACNEFEVPISAS